jgi:hypothetical protein
VHKEDFGFIALVPAEVTNNKRGGDTTHSGDEN